MNFMDGSSADPDKNKLIRDSDGLHKTFRVNHEVSIICKTTKILVMKEFVMHTFRTIYIITICKALRK